MFCPCNPLTPMSAGFILVMIANSTSLRFSPAGFKTAQIAAFAN
jgi:hypothetical protein